MTSKKSLVLISIFLLSLFISACSSAIYASTGWHGLAASSDTAYLAAGTQVYAVDLKTHAQKWTYKGANAKVTFYSNPVLTSDGQLLVPSYDHNLYSIDTATGVGKVLFSGAKNRLIASPLVFNNIIYQPSADEYIYAINLDGTQAWAAQKTGGQIWATPATGPDCGCIYVASMDHIIYKFDAANGTLLNKSQDLGGAIVGTPVVGSDGTLYVGTFGKKMLALDGSSLEIKWQYDTKDWVWAGPQLAGDVLYFGDLAGEFYALNTDGTARWQIQAKSAIVDTPVVEQDNIYFSTESDTLYIVNTSGAVVASPVIGGVIYSSPVITGDSFLVAPTNFDAALVALNLQGTQQWSFTPGK